MVKGCLLRFIQVSLCRAPTQGTAPIQSKNILARGDKRETDLFNFMDSFGEFSFLRPAIGKRNPGSKDSF